jgi:hypothetical protein
MQLGYGASTVATELKAEEAPIHSILDESNHMLREASFAMAERRAHCGI